MPEGPEVARQADQIRAAVAGQVAQVEFGLPRLASFDALLSGRRVEEVRARGKAFLIRFEGGETIYAHLQLFGKWIVRKQAGEPKTTRSLRLRIATPKGSAFLYSASEIEVLEPDELALHPYLCKLGPDLLDPDLSEAEVRARLGEAAWARSSLGALLLRQDLFAGLGNYLRSEILHQARLHPATRLGQLSAAERRRLAKAVLELPRLSYRTGGITNEARRVARLKAAGVRRRAYRWLAFERAGGECYRCCAEILRCEVGGRRLYLCPSCQPEPE